MWIWIKWRIPQTCPFALENDETALELCGLLEYPTKKWFLAGELVDIPIPTDSNISPDPAA